MDILSFIKEFSGELIKNTFKVMKKHAKQIISGFCGAGIALISYLIGKKKGEEKGYEKGCIDISAIYDEKFKLQTEAFLEKQKSYEKNKKEYDKLIKEFEKEILKLEKKVQKSKDEINELRFLLEKKGELLRLKKVG